MRVYLYQRFVTILCGLVFAFSLFGCAPYEFVTVQSSYLSAAEVLPDSTAILPTKVQDESDKRRLALPPDLRAHLQAIVVQTWNERPDPRYLGDATSEFHEFNRKLNRLPLRMTVEVLLWASRQMPEERAAHLQVRQLQPLPALKVEAPPVVEEPITLEHPAVQAGGGFLSGLALGPVPFGPTGVDVAIQLKLLPKGTYWAQVGRACGEVVIGTGQIILGCGGMSAGVGMSGTGAGAPAGVLVFSESMAIAGNGALTLGHGVADGVRLLRDGAPEDPPAPSEVKLLARKGDPKPAPPPQAAAAPPKAPPSPNAAGAPPPGTTVVKTGPTGNITKTRTRTRPGETPTETKTVHIDADGNVGSTTTTRTKPTPTQQATGVNPKVPDAPAATSPYARPSGATTPAQRAAVQGKPCVDCGSLTPRQVADHKKPLVKEHYETGAIDKARMRSAEAVQPQCSTCSSRQGAEMSRYSRQQRKQLQERTP